MLCPIRKAVGIWEVIINSQYQSVMRTFALYYFKKALPILFLMLLPLTIRCQDSVSLPKHIIKFSPLHLIGKFPTLQIAYERNIRGKLSVQLDAGYVLNYTADDEKKDFRGFKLREELRYYYKLKNYNRKNLKYSKSSYLSVETLQNIINYEGRYMDYDCNCTVSQYVKLRETGINFKIGYTEYLSRFILDFSAGLSFRHIRYREPYFYRQDVDYLSLNLIEPQETNQNIITPVFGFRTGYRIGK